MKPEAPLSINALWSPKARKLSRQQLNRLATELKTEAIRKVRTKQVALLELQVALLELQVALLLKTNICLWGITCLYDNARNFKKIEISNVQSIVSLTHPAGTRRSAELELDLSNLCRRLSGIS